WAGIFCPPERLQEIQTTIAIADGSAGHAVRSVSAQRLGIGLRREADEAPATEVENRPLDHGGLVEHQRDRLLLSEPVLVLVRQLAERRAGTVEQRVPADLARPGFEPAAIDAFRLVIVESVGDAMRVEPGARPLHGVTVLDSVDGDALRHEFPYPLMFCL